MGNRLTSDVNRMTKRNTSTADKTFFGAGASVEELAKAAEDCKACDLWKRATQTVFGEGGSHAKVIFAGEQPGNQEDLEGKPFVGPAGKLLDAALEEAGIDRMFETPRIEGKIWRKLPEKWP